MPSNDACRHRSAIDDAHNDEPTVIATLEAVLAGHPIGPRSNGALCIGCGAVLHETDIVFAYAYRCAESVQWNVPRLYCYSCTPSTIKSPTLGTTEVLMGGRLGAIALPTSRTHQLCLTELAVRAYSNPTEGRPP